MQDLHNERDIMTVRIFDDLTHRLQYSSSESADAVLTDICSGLIEISTVRAAGLFRLDETSDSLHWIALEPDDDDLMHRFLVQNRKELISMLRGGSQTVQQEYTDQLPMVSVPAGAFDGAPLGIGISTNRPLESDEVERLSAFAVLAGLIAENTRLTSLLAEDDEAGSTARLLGFIAHELRTPLTGMRGNIQLAMMANRKGQHERIPSRLEAAINGVDNMTALVQKLLDVSRLERGAYPLSPTMGRIGESIQRGVESFLSESGDNPAVIPVDGDFDSEVHHDQQAFQETICLLLKSIAPYLEPSGSPVISIADDGVLVRIRIHYTGSRFSGDDLAALSAPLSSTRPSSERHDHLSLDLAYARGVIRRHSGQIVLHADSPAPGQQTIDILLPH
jgi:signal transduction histidine kinase